MSTIKKNFLYNVLYQILIMILPLITAPYVTRTLGATNLGIYSYSYSIINYFILFAMMGINNYGNRTIAYYREDKTLLSKNFWGIYLLQILFSIIVILIYTIYICFFDINHKKIALIQMIYLFSTVIDINWLFFGLEKFKLTVMRNIIVKLVTVGLIFIFVKTKDDLWIYTLILSGGTLISQIIMLYYAPRFIKFELPAIGDIKKHIKPIIILFIPVISVSVYKILSKIMLGEFSTLNQVGYFEYAMLIITVPLTISVALGTVMLPRMSNLIGSNKIEQGKKYIKYSMMFSIFISSAMGFGLSAISQNFVPLFYGSSFVDSGVLVELLAPTVVFTAWANVIRTQYLIPNRFDNQYIKSVVAGAVVNIVINILLIPSYGAYGAAIGTFFAEAIVCIYQTYAVRKVLDIKGYFVDNFVFIILGFTMLIIIKVFGYYYNGKELSTLFLQVSIGAAFYITTSLLYIKYKGSETLNLIKAK